MILGIKETPYSALKRYPSKIEWLYNNSMNEVVCYGSQDREQLLNMLINAQTTNQKPNIKEIKYIKAKR